MSTMLKSLLKKIVFVFLSNNIRINGRLKRINDNDLVVILNLHRVAGKDGSAYSPLDPMLFRELLKFCNMMFHITTFNELKFLGKTDKPKLILSFDDGYKDFIDIAVPILDELKVKVNQNIIPACVINGLPPLNVMMQDFIGKAPPEILTKLDVPDLNLTTLVGSRVSIGMKVSSHIKTQPMVQQYKLREYLLPQINSFNELQFTPMMNEGDIMQLMNTHEFGVHSFEHANMGAETNEYFISDLENCRNFFIEKFNKNVDIYAFPNGSYRDEQIEIALENGYKHLLLVDDDFSKTTDSSYKRFTFYSESISESKVRAAGNLLKF